MDKTNLFIESKTMRESVIDRIDVLERVKKLPLLPDDIHVTIDMAADYYEVGKEAINSAIKINREELEDDGLKVLTGQELKSLKDKSLIGKKTPSLTVISRRAMLRLGMLLRDSEVAKQVRSYLLDSEEKAKSSDYSQLSPQLQFMITMEQRTNELEAKHTELNQAFRHLSLVVDNEVWITDHQRADIKQAVLSRVGHLKSQSIDAHFQGAFSDLNKFFGVPKYDKIKRSDYEQAMDFIHGWYPKRKESTSL